MGSGRGTVVWMTGLSAAGKSTLAQALSVVLAARNLQPVVLDGDDIRAGLSADLGFSESDRAENIRRVSHVARLFADAGLAAICAFISPQRAGRERAAELVGRHRFVEVFVDAPLSVCEERDPKGLYARARRGEIASFTGIDSPYERPKEASVTVDTAALEPAQCVEAIIEHLVQRGIMSPESEQ